MRKSPVTLSNEQKQDVCRRYIEGESARKIAFSLSVSIGNVTTILAKNQIQRRTLSESNLKYRCDEQFFARVSNCERAAYWAGFIAADGCISDAGDVTIQLGGRDVGHLNRFKSALSSECVVHTYSYKSSTSVCAVRVRSRLLAADLQKIGIGPRKSFTLQWPDLPEDALRHFLRGYVDGDGCWHVYHPKRQFIPVLGFKVIGSLDFLSGCQAFLMNKCQLPEVKKWVCVSKCGRVQELRYGGNNQVRRIADFLYRDATIYLPRKFAIVQPFLSRGIAVQPLTS